MYDKLGDCDPEVAAGFFYFITVDVEHRSDFSLVAVASSEGIEYDNVANLGTFEFSSFLFR